MTNEKMLSQISKLVNDGLTKETYIEILSMIGANTGKSDATEYKLWGDYLPLGRLEPYNEEQRLLHILWETIDRVPLGIDIDFTIPYRRIIAKKLFKKCGKGFIANEGCRFNYGQNIEIGDYVTWNHCCYIDSKGGVTFEDYSCITEYSKIFTHSHSESDHAVRSYAPVKLERYAKVYTACTLLPGVVMGEGSIAATGAIVTKSVPPMTVVAGIPAKPIRSRRDDGKELDEFNHYCFYERAFQEEDAD